MGVTAAVAAVVTAGTAIYSASETQKQQLAASDRAKNQQNRQNELLNEQKVAAERQKAQAAQRTLADQRIAQFSSSPGNKGAGGGDTVLTSPLGFSPSSTGGNKTVTGY